MRLGIASTIGLGDKVEVSVGLAAAPYATLGPDGERKCRNLVQMPPGIIGIDVRDTVGLHEDRKDVGAHASGLSDLEIHVGADVGLGILELGVPVALIGILVESAGIGIIKIGIILDPVGATVHRDESIGLVRGILEDFVLPVHVGIDERIAAVLELLKLGLGVGEGASIVHTGDVKGIGIVVSIDHVGHLRIELDLAGGAGLEVESALRHAALGLYEEDAVDGFVPVKGYGGGIFEDGHALNLFYSDAVDGALDSIDKYEYARFTGSLDSSDVEGCSPAFLAFETGVLDGGQAKELAIQCIGKAYGRCVAELFRGDRIGRRSGEELRTLNTVSQIHLL